MGSGLPPPYGLTAHIKLSRIAGCIVSNTYSIAPREGMNNTEDAVAQPLRMLNEWREGLESRLQIPLDLPAEPQIPFEDTPDLGTPMGSTGKPVNTYADRALCTLHMKYNQVRLDPVHLEGPRAALRCVNILTRPMTAHHPHPPASVLPRCQVLHRRRSGQGPPRHFRSSASRLHPAVQRRRATKPAARAAYIQEVQPRR